MGDIYLTIGRNQIRQNIAQFVWIMTARIGTKWRAIWEPNGTPLIAELSQMNWLTKKSKVNTAYCLSHDTDLAICHVSSNSCVMVWGKIRGQEHDCKSS